MASDAWAKVWDNTVLTEYDAIRGHSDADAAPQSIFSGPDDEAVWTETDAAGGVGKLIFGDFQTQAR